MPTNPYFNHFSNPVEKDFYDSFIVESIQIGGIDIRYLVRTYEIEQILRDPQKSSFDQAYTIEAYLHNIKGFDGPGEIMTKFGFRQVQSCEFSIAKSRWRELSIPEREDRPREGDIVILSFEDTNYAFEIMKVDFENPFWEIGRYYVFRLFCETYQKTYNEKINIDPDLDQALNPDNITEIEKAINTKLSSQSSSLLDFSEKNPFGDL